MYSKDGSDADCNLETYVNGNNETVHPSVVNIGEIWNGYQYWMANTPYPDGDNQYENPSIWASRDGDTWVVPNGLTNPISATPLGGFNADTELIYENGALYCFWMRDGILVYSSSTNGITWSDYANVTTVTQPISPTIVKDGSSFIMYYVEDNDGTYVIRKETASTVTGPYSNKTTPTGITKEPWHIGCKIINNKTWLLIRSNTDSSIYPYLSLDGDSFSCYNNQSLTISEGAVYRPSPIEIANGDVRVYYSRVLTGPIYMTYYCELGIINK